VGHDDNPAFNPYNPDPEATVREGQKTRNETMDGYFFYLDADERLNLAVNAKMGRVK
jgi:hypothetical protein